MHKYIIILILSVFSISAHAFKAEKHKQPTLDAVDLYNQCAGYYEDEFDLKLSNDDKNFIAQANHKVDNISFPRLWNWHFYDKKFNYKTLTAGNIGRGFLWTNRSLHKIFVKKSKNLRQLKKDKKHLMKHLGYVMHFIQDMSVPAHVAPIYHVTGKEDNFDGYTPSKTRMINFDKEDCRGLIDNQTTPVSILESLAKSTLLSIQTRVNEKLHWSAFWNVYPENPSSKRKGFSTYGTCGNIFGDTTNTKCRVNKTTYDKYYNTRYEEAVKASLELLIFVGKRDTNLE